MIENILESVYIIDDKYKEIVRLKNLLLKNQILSQYYNPTKLISKGIKLNNKKIIFLDLYIDESESSLSGQISQIRKILQKSIGLDFGAYGIILWTRHTNEANIFKEKIQKDTRYNKPLFIIDLNKTYYIELGNFNSLFNDIEEKLKENLSANFYFQWEYMVKKGKNKSIYNIYSPLLNNYKLQNENLKYILFFLAKNFTGIPINQISGYALYIDAFKSFSDLLLYELYNQKIEIQDFLNDIENISYICNEDVNYKKDIKDKYYHNDEIIDTKNDSSHDSKLNILNKEIVNIFSILNTNLLIDYGNLNDNNVIPGNVYKILDESKFKLDQEDRPADSIPILIEITPPCDFSQNKAKNPRCIGGFLTKFSTTKTNHYNKEYHYKEIWPIQIDQDLNTKLIIFDFRYFDSVSEDDLKDITKYKLIFRAKDKLFADILQKFSSHSARLGLSIIHL